MCTARHPAGPSHCHTARHPDHHPGDLPHGPQPTSHHQRGSRHAGLVGASTSTTLAALLTPVARYDILSLDEKDSRREDMEGVDRAVEYVHSLVQVVVMGWSVVMGRSGVWSWGGVVGWWWGGVW